MNKAAERDLLSILPSITLPLPRELLDTTVSLFSQSKSKANSLKQDEEIARGYVCANIACNRLKSKLNLPSIVVRPPVAPKIYKKLYAYLDSALSARTPKKTEEQGTPKKERVGSANATPSKARSTPAKAPTTKQLTGKRKRDEDGHEMPDWVMPAIRSLSKVFKIPTAAPHIFVGVSSILGVIREQQAALTATPAKKRSHRGSEKAPSEAVAGFEDVHIAALIVVVTMYTLSHLTGPPSTEVYEKQREKAIKVLLKAAPEGYRQEEEDMISTVEIMLREAQNGWLEMEWFSNLPEAEVLNGDDDEEEGEGEEEDVVDVELPKRGFGTMMTDATDWLSEERRKEFKRWKTDVLKRIENIEKGDKGKGRSART